MKKIILLLIALLIICGCDKKVSEEDFNYSSLGIITPTGAPSLAFIDCINNENFETNSIPNNIISMMNDSSDKRLVVIDAISGIKAIKNGSPYKLAAIITFGNFYIASTGLDDNGVMDKGDKIVLFGQNMTPDIVFHYLYSDEYDSNIDYVNAVSDAGKCLAAGKNFQTGESVDYVFIAEPVLSTVLSNENVPTYKKSSIYKNIQDEYTKKTGSLLIQAGLFVKDDGYIKDINDFYNHYEDNINKILTDNNYVNSFLTDKSKEEVSSIYGINPELINEVLKNNSVGLGFKKALDIKEEIDKYIKLFGMEETSGEIYYK